MSRVSNKRLDSLVSVASAYLAANNRLLLLDGDGTLVPFAAKPEQAKPSAKTLSVIKKLASDSHNTVVIISGRDRNTLDTWLGHLPIQFVAEHGVFEKIDGGWRASIDLDSTWKEKARPIIRNYVQMIPGSLLEEKESALVYHYRNAVDQSAARSAAHELLQKLKPLVTELGLHSVHASMVVEIRQSGTDKGQAALAELGRRSYDFILCAGDSQTDEDMFKRLAQQAFCIKVGSGQTAASYQVKNPETLVNFLTTLAEADE
ncbi:trehalose-phosphatase [Candidatus Saccharibacteria bacterium]|nr:trehalose-phosphatase [Candidatus Saccharibacteria bacterium]